jgi:hypothetical protein
MLGRFGARFFVRRASRQSLASDSREAFENRHLIQSLRSTSLHHYGFVATETTSLPLSQ